MENIWNIYARHYDTLRLLPAYQTFQKTIKVVGVDNSIEMIKMARAKVGNDQRVDLYDGSIDSIIKTFNPSSYQIVVMSNVLYNLKNPVEIISKIDELLYNGGILIISDPKPNFRYSLV